MLARYVRGRFTFLLGSLLLLLTAYPYVNEGRVGDFLLTLLFVSIPVTGVVACRQSHRDTWIAIVLGLPAILASIDVHMRLEFLPVHLAQISMILFYGFTTVVVFHAVITSKTITANTIYGALCVYLLVGLVYAGLFSIVHHVDPGAILFDDTHNIDGVIDSRDYIYFSFVTLTTLGYGDITPLSDPARSLSMLEAVTGVIFMATTIARLVGIHAAQHSGD